MEKLVGYKTCIIVMSALRLQQLQVPAAGMVGTDLCSLTWQTRQQENRDKLSLHFKAAFGSP